MKTKQTHRFCTTRRSFLGAMLVAGSAPVFVPAHVLGTAGQTAPSNKITLGVIGVGDQGRSDLQGFLGLQDVRVTAICDINQRNIGLARSAIQRAYGTADVKGFADFRELNAQPSIDAVLMVLPVHWHSRAALDAILQGKHIYHEKPMALSLEEGKRVRAAVQKKKVVFQFGTQQRSDPKFRWACELALNGRLGKIKDIYVSVPGGKKCPTFPERPVPDYLDWDRWVGPAAITPFNEEKLKRDNHENMNNFSLGMISCWGIHHLDIAQWGAGADRTGPSSVTVKGEFPDSGSCDAILRWEGKFEYAGMPPISFFSDGHGPYEHGIRFVSADHWLHVRRGAITAKDEKLLEDPLNKCGSMPVKLPVSDNHFRNFIDAIHKKTSPICDVETAMRSEALCQLAYIAVKRGRKLQWDPPTELFLEDTAPNAMLLPRPSRGDWKLPEV